MITLMIILSLDLARYASATCEEEIVEYREENAVIGGFNTSSVLPDLTEPTDIFNYCSPDETFSLTCTAEFSELADAFEDACEEVGGIYVTYDLETSSDGCNFAGFALGIKVVAVPQCLGPSCDADDYGQSFTEEINKGIADFGVTDCNVEITDVSVGGPSGDDSQDENGVISTKEMYLSVLLGIFSTLL